MSHADAAFTIGKTHTVCQDYALAQNTADGSPFCAAWLSDGCSSSPHTDIGARLLVHAMQTQTERIAKSGEPLQTALKEAICQSVRQGKHIAVQMGVPDSALDATLLGLVETGASSGEARTLHAIMVGDGALVLGKTDGSRIVYRAHFAAGYPFYPAYLEDMSRLSQWRGVQTNTHTATKTVLRPDGLVRSERIVTLTTSKQRFVFRFPAANLRFAAVLSDGVESFQQRAGGDGAPQSVPYLDAIRELTDFKQFAGQFAQRRLQAFGKVCATRLNWQHSDDVSLAALYFG